MSIDSKAVLAAAASYRDDISRFLREMIAIPSESAQEEAVVQRIKRLLGFHQQCQVVKAEVVAAIEFDGRGRIGDLPEGITAQSGTLRIPWGTPLPDALLDRVIALRLAELGG